MPAPNRHEGELPVLELLEEPAGLPAFALPAELARAYGGALGFVEPRLIANFVSTLDGVVALPGTAGAVRAIRGDSEADPFVMGLLRACADALLVGATTFRASQEARWIAESVYPKAARAYAALRLACGRSQPPELAVVTQRGRLDPDHPAFEAGEVVVLTSDAAARVLGRRLPARATVIALGAEVTAQRAIAALHARGHRLLLTEGGPTTFGSLLGAGVVDELFLTVSPLLGGRGPDTEQRGLVEGLALLPGRSVSGRLLGVRRAGSHLYLRYELPATARRVPPFPGG